VISLAVAYESATAHLPTAQSQYISKYLRMRDKHFNVGDPALILNPYLTSSRLWSRWQAPATVVDKQGDYSYFVETH
jgi:hypothetical protein